MVANAPGIDVGTFVTGAVTVAPQTLQDHEGLPPELSSLADRVLLQRRASVLRAGNPAPGEVDSLAPFRAGLVLPWYVRERIERYLVLLVSNGTGTLETWVQRSDDSVVKSSALVLGSGYFAGLDEFLRVSALTRFRLGEGLPGRALSELSPVVLVPLTDSTAFLRAAAAESAGLEMGIALPVPYPDGLDIATILLSSAAARCSRIDLWDAASSPRHCATVTRGADRNDQRELAAEIASMTAVNARPEALGGVGGSGDGAGVFGFSWLATGRTSLPRIVTVVI